MVIRLDAIRQTLGEIAEYLNGNPTPATPERQKRLNDEQIATDFATIEVLVESADTYRRGIDSRDWWNTRHQEEWNSEQDWWNPDRGIPLSADGKPQFVAVPRDYAPNLGLGERVLFLLDEI